MKHDFGLTKPVPPCVLGDPAACEIKYFRRDQSRPRSPGMVWAGVHVAIVAGQVTWTDELYYELSHCRRTPTTSSQRNDLQACHRPFEQGRLRRGLEAGPGGRGPMHAFYIAESK